ncbi:MAG: YlxR family protein [Corynebacterium sp.]|nr:YlxR family protein [Corynebacterium sp.]
MSVTTQARTCIATRKSGTPATLLRVAIGEYRDGTAIIYPDPHRRMPGRGAWITPTVQAYEQAAARRAFQRAFRVSTPVDAGHVREYLADPTM